MTKTVVVFLTILFSFTAVQAQKHEVVVKRVADHWLQLHNNFENTADAWGNYTLDLTLEALLKYDKATKNNTYTVLVKDVFNKRGIQPSDTISYRSQPFCSINFTLGEITGNKKWYNGFIAESYTMFQNDKRSPDGAILNNHEDRHRILIDYMQEYSARLAKTGYLTGDTSLFDEVVNQFLIYEKLLRNEETGLWSQGRGWCEDTMKLGEGAWSRGHGWLLRGIISSMKYLPEKHRTQLLPVLVRTSESLKNVQAESGMFHILLHLPHNHSAPDVSGTGMIAYYLSIAVNEGWLDKEKWRSTILKSANAIKTFITEKGEVRNSSKGPGPLCNDEEYRNYIPEKDEHHGFQGVIYGMIAEMYLSE